MAEVRGEHHWDEVVRRKTVRLSSDAAIAFRGRRRDGWQEGEIIGLWQAPGSAGYSTKGHFNGHSLSPRICAAAGPMGTETDLRRLIFIY